MKYAKEAAPNLVVDFGGGLSYSYAKLTNDPYSFYPGTTRRVRGEDSLLGGQVFADLTYKLGWFYCGVNGKYQVTQDFKHEGFDLSNYRLGIQLAIVF